MLKIDGHVAMQFYFPFSPFFTIWNMIRDTPKDI